MTPYYDEGGITIYHGDCREIVPALRQPLDALVTDPPYGVLLGQVNKARRPYSMFSDTPAYLEKVCIPVIRLILTVVKRGAIFCGSRNVWLYPPADEIGCWYIPSSPMVGKWGFLTAQPILYYGKSPRAGRGDNANSFSMTTHSDDVDHPCPKPISVMKWLVRKASLDMETIIDPFMGSGTTLRAVKDLGGDRRAIGIEIEERYCEIAVRRLTQAILPLSCEPPI